MDLQEYRRKRRFDVTPEPSGKTPPRDERMRQLAYVIQEHRARSLHYDFRLEWKDVMLSWALPKGPSLDPTVKRLAIPTEDHPLEYKDFEGTIPEGEYGAGTVMVWDRGTWVPDDPDVDAKLRQGDLKFTLHGKKLKGSWVLVHTKTGYPPGSGRPSWLLIKHRDAFASKDDITAAEPRSVVSKRTLAEIARDSGGDAQKAEGGDPPGRAGRSLKTAVRARPRSRARAVRTQRRGAS